MFLGLTHGGQELVRKIPNIGLTRVGSRCANLHNLFSLRELLRQGAGSVKGGAGIDSVTRGSSIFC